MITVNSLVQTLFKKCTQLCVCCIFGCACKCVYIYTPTRTYMCVLYTPPLFLHIKNSTLLYFKGVILYEVSCYFLLHPIMCPRDLFTSVYTYVCVSMCIHICIYFVTAIHCVMVEMHFTIIVP